MGKIKINKLRNYFFLKRILIINNKIINNKINMISVEKTSLVVNVSKLTIELNLLPI